MTDLYGILGVSNRASAAEIKSAYRRLARKLHPDVSTSPDANASFSRIHDAYYILSDPRRRAAYDNGVYEFSKRTFYASHAAEVATIQRKFDRMVDEMLARERQETAARSEAVLIVVPLFVSAFYVMAAKPVFLEGLNLAGKAVIIALSISALIYLVKRLSAVLSRYTYEAPDHLTSVFKEEAPRDKAISRRAGVVFLACGYFVSLGLGYVVSKLVPLLYKPDLTASTFLGVLLYPPIAVFIIGSIRRLCVLLDPFRAGSK